MSDSPTMNASSLRRSSARSTRLKVVADSAVLLEPKASTKVTAASFAVEVEAVQAAALEVQSAHLTGQKGKNVLAELPGSANASSTKVSGVKSVAAIGTDPLTFLVWSK